jgi:hypothetical protein
MAVAEKKFFQWLFILFFYAESSIQWKTFHRNSIKTIMQIKTKFD